MHSTPQSPQGTVGFFFAAAAGRGGFGADLHRSAGVAAFVVAGGAVPWLLACAGGGSEDVPGARWAYDAGCGGTCCGCAGAVWHVDSCGGWRTPANLGGSLDERPLCSRGMRRWRAPLISARALGTFLALEFRTSHI